MLECPGTDGVLLLAAAAAAAFSFGRRQQPCSRLRVTAGPARCPRGGGAQLTLGLGLRPALRSSASFPSSVSPPPRPVRGPNRLGAPCPSSGGAEDGGRWKELTTTSGALLAKSEVKSLRGGEKLASFLRRPSHSPLLFRDGGGGGGRGRERGEGGGGRRRDWRAGRPRDSAASRERGWTKIISGGAAVWGTGGAPEEEAGSASQKVNDGAANPKHPGEVKGFFPKFITHSRLAAAG